MATVVPTYYFSILYKVSNDLHVWNQNWTKNLENIKEVHIYHIQLKALGRDDIFATKVTFYIGIIYRHLTHCLLTTRKKTAVNPEK